MTWRFLSYALSSNLEQPVWIAIINSILAFEKQHCGWYYKLLRGLGNSRELLEIVFEYVMKVFAWSRIGGGLWVLIS